MTTRGHIIKTLREEKGMSQEKLADGICSISTLSKIENNIQVVSASNFNELLEKMGENPEKYSFTMEKYEEDAVF